MTSPSLSLVLVRPQKASNLGSVARVAKNFGLRHFAVVEPAVPVDEESHRLAAGADDLLDSIVCHDSLSSAVAQFPVVITTSSFRGRGRERSLELRELPDFLEEAGGRISVVFVFGPERSGLTEDELSRASARLRLPTHPSFPTLNLSHAVGVVLAVARGFGGSGPEPPRSDDPAPSAEVEAAIAHWDGALEAIDFYDTGHRERSLRDWRKLIAGRPLTRREVAILRGVANRVLVSVKRSGASERHPEERSDEGSQT